MTGHTTSLGGAARRLPLAASSALLPLTGWGFGFTINDDLRGVWNNTLSIGTARRWGNPDPQFVGFNNAREYPGARGAVAVADDGNLNFRKNDTISTPMAWLTELELRWRNQYGVLVRARAWYDYQLNHGGVPHGSGNNGFVPGAELNDSLFYSNAKFSGLQWLDAYVYGNWEVGDNKLGVRLGQQVVNWGESLLYTGINAFNPLDPAAAARPGTRAELALLPVNRVLANFITRDGLMIEGFYTLDWQRNTLPECGTFGELIDSQVSSRACLGSPLALPLSDRAQYLLGSFAPALPAIDAGKGGQWGVSARYFVEPLGTEFGLYYVRYNNPMLVTNVIPKSPQSPIGVAIQNQYLEGVQGAAISAATGFENVALSAELSTLFGLPVQRNFPTLVQAAVGQGGPYADAASLPTGQSYPGYLRVNRTQLLLGGRINLAPVVALSDFQLTAEVALQWTPDLPGPDQERIGRNPNLGTATFNGSCQGGYNVCTVDGFATSFNWGYRLAGQFSLPRPAAGVDLIPFFGWLQDVKGYAVDGTMAEGRYAAALGLRMIYQSLVSLELGGTWFRHDTPYDPLRDRSNYWLGVGVRF